MIYDTRPSRFSACNIESWEWPGDKATCTPHALKTFGTHINVVIDSAFYSWKSVTLNGLDTNDIVKK